MNDTVVLVGIGVVIAAFVWFFIIRDNNEKKDVYFGEPKDPPTQKGRPGGKPVDAPAPAPAKTAPKLPTAKTLEGMTKAKLEELGREHGLELDKRKTKANMIADLKAGVKK